MLENYRAAAGQFCGLAALLLCLLAFASKRDERLMLWLLSANVAFALQFLFFRSWTAAALTLLVMLRIVLARRFPGSVTVMAAVLAISGAAAVLTWQSWADVPSIIAMALGTIGMFLFSGIAMRIFLGFAAFAWLVSHALVGSVGGILAETLVLLTNAVTVYRLVKAEQGSHNRA